MEEKGMNGMKTTPRRFIKRLQARIRRDRKTFILYSVLRVLVIVVAVRTFLEGNLESFAICILSLILFLLPAFAEERFKIEIPPLFEGIIYLFIFAAEILGEIDHFYINIPGWDTMLHTINGFVCAAVGLSMVYLLNAKSDNLNLSPFYLVVAAFCFSMTVGVIWEFIEFSMDQVFYLDMQKDFIVQNIGSVTLDPTHSQIPVKVSGITRTLIETSAGKTYTVEGGYLDIGIIDTMKDLFVNFVGAIVFDLFGYVMLKKNPGHMFVDGLIIRQMTSEEKEEAQEIVQKSYEKPDAVRKIEKKAAALKKQDKK